MIHPHAANVALGTSLLALGSVLLILHGRIASFWTWQRGTPTPTGAHYFVRYLLGSVLLVVAGILVLTGVLGLR